MMNKLFCVVFITTLCPIIESFVIRPNYLHCPPISCPRLSVGCVPKLGYNGQRCPGCPTCIRQKCPVYKCPALPDCKTTMQYELINGRKCPTCPVCVKPPMCIAPPCAPPPPGCNPVPQYTMINGMKCPLCYKCEWDNGYKGPSL